MSKIIGVTAYRWDELSETAKAERRMNDQDRQSIVLYDVSERLTGILEELTGASAITPSNRNRSADLSLEWRLSHSQGDGVAFYGRIDAADMLAALTIPDRSMGYVDTEALVKISGQDGLDKAIQVLRDLGPRGWIRSERTSLSNHYSHYNTMSFDLYEVSDSDEPLDPREDDPLVDFLRDVSRYLEREGYEFLEAEESDDELERYYAGYWFDETGGVLEVDKEEAREAHLTEIEERQTAAYLAARTANDRKD
jgi:hypothetical protein